jgi:hypothetical protein
MKNGNEAMVYFFCCFVNSFNGTDGKKTGHYTGGFSTVPVGDG